MPKAAVAVARTLAYSEFKLLNSYIQREIIFLTEMLYPCNEVRSLIFMDSIRLHMWNQTALRITMILQTLNSSNN